MRGRLQQNNSVLTPYYRLVILIFLMMIASLGMTSCNKKNPLNPDLNPGWNIATIITDDLKCSLQTDKKEYLLGETVIMVYKITNIGNTDVLYSSNGSSPCYYEINNGENIIWNHPDYTIDSVVRQILKPGESHEYNIAWDMYSQNPPYFIDRGSIVKPGVYTAAGQMISGKYRVALSIVINPSPKVLKDNIQYIMKIDKSSYSLGETINVKYIITNLGETNVEYNFTSSLQYSFGIRDQNDTRWIWNTPQQEALMPTKIILLPGESKTFSASWPQIDQNNNYYYNDDTKANPGKYKIIGGMGRIWQLIDEAGSRNCNSITQYFEIIQ